MLCFLHYPYKNCKLDVYRPDWLCDSMYLSIAFALSMHKTTIHSRNIHPYIYSHKNGQIRSISFSVFFRYSRLFFFFFFLFFLYIRFSCSPFVTNKQNVLLLQIPVSYENCARFLTHRFVCKIYWYERDDHMESIFFISYTAISLHFIHIELYVWRVFKI